MDDEAQSKLGFDASSAIASIEKLKRELAGYSAAMAKVAGGSRAFNSAQIQADDILKRLAISSAIAAGTLKNLAGAQNAAAASASNFASQQAKAQKVAQTAFQKAVGINPNAPVALGGDQIGAASREKQIDQLKRTEAALRQVAGRASETGKAVKAGAEEGAEGARNLEVSWRSVVRVFGIQFAARAVANIVGAFTNGIKAARGFEIQLAEILTISKEFQTQGIDAVGDVVARLSAQFGRPVEDVAKGLYQTLSNQIGNAAESTRFLSESLEFSVAAVTSSADAVDLLSGVLNAYGLTAASTARISDELFKTIELGRVTGTQLANTYGRITTLSAQLGVSTAEVNAVIAELTINGVAASDALTQVSNLFLKLIQPSKNTAKAFDELGIASAEVGLALDGVAGFLGRLSRGKTALSDVADLLGGRIRAIRGASTILSNTQRLNETLQKVQASARATADAFKLIDATAGQRLTKQLEEARATLVNGFGRNAIAIFADLIDAIGGVNTALIGLGITVGTLTGGSLLIFATQAAFALKAMGLAAVGASTGVALLAGAGLAAIVAVPAALVIGFNRVGSAADAARKEVAKIQTETDARIKDSVAAILPDIKETQANLDTQKKAILASLVEQTLATQRAQTANITANRAVTADLQKNLKDRASLVKASVDALEARIKTLKDSSKDLSRDIRDVIRDASQGQLERGISDLGPQGQIVARRQEIERLQSEANRLSLTGDPEQEKEAVKLLGQAFQAAEKLADTVEGRRIGEKAINDLKSAGLRIDANIQNTNAKEIKNAQTQLDKNAEFEATIKSLKSTQTAVVTGFKDVNIEIENAKNNVVVFGEELDGAGEKVTAVISKIRDFLAKSSPSQIPALNFISEQTITAIEDQNLESLTRIRDTLVDQIGQLQGEIDNQGLATKLKSFIFGGGDQETQAQLKILAESLSGITEAIAKVNTADSAASDLNTKLQAISSLGTAATNNEEVFGRLPQLLKDIGVGGTDAGTGLGAIGTAAPTAISGINNVQTTVNGFSAQRIVDEATRAAAALRAIGGAGALPTAQRFGGRILNFAGGGFASRGTDVVPAMLSRGEFVVNAASSRNFFSQLTAINAGRRPNFRQSGGEVTNVGDINVSVAGGDNSQQTIKQIADGLQRQIRQRRINLKGK